MMVWRYKRRRVIGAALLLALVSLLVYNRGYLTALLPGFLPAGLTLEQIRLPPGFAITLYSDAVPGARSMTLGPGGTLFVGTRGEGKVYALVDGDGDQRAERVYTIAEGLYMPNGVAVHDGDLYVAEVDRILRFVDIERQLATPPKPEVVNRGFPGESHHGWKFIAFGPDGRLYVPVGAPCNVCLPEGLHASITRMNADGSGLEVIAHGVRNSVGFDWQPDSGELWFTDNGRDWLGEDRPPDELNRLREAGQHFGYPYCHGEGLADPEFNNGLACSDFEAPALALGPHVAALGMRFYRGRQFPERYRGGIFIAEHGSWNRKVPIGYRVMFVPLAGGQPTGYEVFAEGWLLKGLASGRPVDVQELADGSLLVSDDRAGAIYRIRYTP